MFQDLTENLTCEIKTLAYPRAAVFAFCLAVMAWNGMSVIHAALRSVHGEETVEETVSGYYLALEISQVYHGMMIAIPAEEWTIFQNLRGYGFNIYYITEEIAANRELPYREGQIRG